MTHGFEKTTALGDPGRYLYDTVNRVMQERFGPHGRTPTVAWELMDSGVPNGFPHEKDAWREAAECFAQYLEEYYEQQGQRPIPF